jgi:sugar/nucleoside kinase (ribokinase family)
MLDVIGIGSLNLDLIVPSEVTEALPQEEVRRAYSIIESCAGGPASLSDLEKVLTLLGRESFRESLGGSAFNTVHALAELGAGIRIGFIGVSGSTGCRMDFLQLMEELSIDSTCVANISEERSGICLCVNRNGSRSLLVYPGSNRLISGHISANWEKILAYASSARVLHLTSFAGEEAPETVAALVDEVKKASPGIKVSFDPGLSWIMNITPAILGIMKSSDMIFLSTQEFNLLSRESRESDSMEKARSIYGRLGLDSCLLVAKLKPDIRVYSHCGGRIVERCFENRLVDCGDISDATGAGDVFNAGFLAALLLRGMDSVLLAAELGSSFAYARLTSSGDNAYRELRRIFREKNI